MARTTTEAYWWYAERRRTQPVAVLAVGIA
jgi:hypothetical protein